VVERDMARERAERGRGVEQRQAARGRVTGVGSDATTPLALEVLSLADGIQVLPVAERAT